MQRVRSSAMAAGAVLIGALALGGCATKDFVREQVATVDGRVSGVESTVNQQGAALSEQGATLTRQGGALQQHDAQLAQLDKTSREALERAEAAGKLAEGKFLFQQVLADDSVKFKAGHAELTPEGQARLTELANRLKAENRNVYVEIQGFTDGRGSEAGNLRLGQDRAEAVRRFLSKQGIALNRMATISYGEDQPVAKNTTRDGRAQNRRVSIVVLA